MKNNISTIRTPYHELGDGSPRVPGWAQHRSVYRSAGRTLYRVETDSLATAHRDLDTLSNRGWDVHIERSISSKASANISLSRKAA